MTRVTSNSYMSGDGKASTMDMLDYRLHYAVMATEDRVRSVRRERKLQRQVRRTTSTLPVDRKPRRP
jgi:hypothetical protein